MKGITRFTINLVIFLCDKTAFTDAYKLSDERAIAFTSDGTSRVRRNADTTNGADQSPQMTELFIESNVSVRFASVLIKSVIQNGALTDSEVAFTVQVPAPAFISRFSMILAGEEFFGVLMEKEDANKVYENAKNDNRSAGLVSQTTPPKAERNFEVFTVSVNMESNSSATFKLRYEELIERRDGVYTQRINVQPLQIVPNITVVCNFYEPQGIIFDPTTGLKTPTTENAVESSHASDPDVRYTASSDTRFSVTYSPSVDTQTSMDPLKGISGDLSVAYDVRRQGSQEAGLTIVNPDNGYVVTFFSPTFPENDLLSKNIIFLIDVSGSMSGPKIEQARNSLLTMISKLRPDDRFNILLFQSEVELWKGGFVPASPYNKELATSFVEQEVNPGGGTNINAGLLAAVTMFENNMPKGNIIYFLTDGDPTTGETNKDLIRENFRLANRNEDGSFKAVLFSLAFGRGVEFDFLKVLSLENGGFARYIYEGSDADDQLRKFFREIADPALKDVTIKLRDKDTGRILTGDTSQNRTPLFFANTEFVMVGDVESLSTTESIVEALGPHGQVEYKPTSLVSSAIQIDPVFIERLYAYKRIKDLLDDEAVTLDEQEASMLREKALNMSLKFQFVTPLTSLVVTQDLPKQQRPSRRKFMEYGLDLNAGMAASYPVISYGNPISGANVASSGSAYTSFAMILFISLT